jgi:hypothetical protein
LSESPDHLLFTDSIVPRCEAVGAVSLRVPCSSELPPIRKAEGLPSRGIEASAAQAFILAEAVRTGFAPSDESSTVSLPFAESTCKATPASSVGRRLIVVIFGVP